MVASPATPALARRLGPFDATMLVMGGIVGSGIFMNPYVVARHVHTPFLILGTWAAGGLIALAGAFIYAELAARRPQVGGQYAYIREAFHPLAAFLYGWGLLLVTQSGGMAAVAVTFARYTLELSGARLADGAVAAIALALLTAVNCLGVRTGSAVQSALMVLKIAAIVALVACGLLLAGAATPARAAAGPGGALLDRPPSLDLLTAFGAALVPVLFAYGGWQTASFVAGEVREPRRNLPRGLLFGVAGVVVLYLAVNAVCLRVLGPGGLAATTTPASDVMRAALGAPGARLIALGIAVSTFGFLAQSMLTAPRVYYAMAADGLFLGALARVHPRTRVPVLAIALQGAWATVIALSGRYEQILSYVVAVDWVFFGLAASCLFVLRRRDRAAGAEPPAYRAPGHPWTTAAFVAVSALVVANTVYKFPAESAKGFGILLAGLPVYAAWRWKERRWPRRAS
ncbi:MAG TPA: amino acid permease [Thermoanaerobaculia bacterium]|nr:amino acid permease [Thermoanaerobaculia bacterium]